MNTYELVTIHTPLLTDQQYREQLDRVKDVITRHGGSVRLEDVWGKRRLAYPVSKQREGNYSVIQFDCPPSGECLSELERFCKIEETVLRHLITRAVLNKSLGTPIEQQRPPAAAPAEAPEAGQPPRAAARRGGPRGAEELPEPAAAVEEGLVPDDDPSSFSEATDGEAEK